MYKSKLAEQLIEKTCTAWKVSKYGAISGTYFPVFGMNTEKYRLEITPQLALFTQW